MDLNKEDEVWLINQISFARSHLVDALDHFQIPESERFKFEPRKPTFMSKFEGQATIYISAIDTIIEKIQDERYGRDYDRHIFGSLETQCPNRRKVTGRDYSRLAWDNLDYDRFHMTIKLVAARLKNQPVVI